MWSPTWLQTTVCRNRVTNHNMAKVESYALKTPCAVCSLRMKTAQLKEGEIRGRTDRNDTNAGLGKERQTKQIPISYPTKRRTYLQIDLRTMKRRTVSYNLASKPHPNPLQPPCVASYPSQEIRWEYSKPFKQEGEI